MRMRTVLFGFWLAAGVSGGWAGPASAAQSDHVFVERFDRTGNGRWTLDSTSPTSPGVRFHTAEEKPGFHFISQGVSSATAAWDVGTEAFELSFEVEMPYGNRAPWRFPGACLAVCSAPPGKAKEEDVALCWSVHAQGLIASVRTGGLFDGAEKRPGVWHFADRSRSPRFVLNQGGAGGHDYSIQWPDKRLAATRLRLHMIRRDERTVEFTAWHERGGDRPWWTGTWQLPEELAAVPLEYVVIKTVLNPGSYEDPNEPIRVVDELRGRVHNIQARRLDGPAAPRVARFSSDAPVLTDGVAIRIHGADFEDGAQVLVNGRPLGGVEYVDNTELRAALDHLTEEGPNVLTVVNSSGLAADLPAELPFGRVVRRAQPREASPQGGDEITLVGGGFDHDTQVVIGGKPAQTVEVIDSTRMKVRVPPAQPGPATIEVTGGGEAFRGSPAFAYAPHPYLWYRGEGLAELRKKFNDPAFADYRRLILEKAAGPEEEMGRIGTPSHAAIIHGYLWAYLLCDEKPHRERLWATVDALLTGTDGLPSDEFGHPGRRLQSLSLDEFMCHNGEAVATVYDSLFEELSPEERTALLEYLDAHLAYYLDRVRANDWWYRNNPSNTIAVGNGCGGTIALALMHGEPAAQETIDLAVENIYKRYVGMAEDGGCIEGNLYWDYGLTYQLLFGHALKNATGDDRGLLTDGKFDKVPRFVETQLGGDGRYFTFNDTQPWLTGMAVCADFGSRLDSPLLRWMADRTARAAATGETTVFTRPQFYALAFRVRDRTPAPKQFPGVPTLAYLPVLNWGVMRSEGSSFEPALVVGVKGRDGQTTHHAQEDLGGFVVHAHGESLLIDPGYYQGKADHHSLPLVDGKGPNSRGKALIIGAWEKAGRRTMIVDATDAYRDAGATRVRRVFALAGDEAVIVLDDIAVAKEKAPRITCQLQCGFPAEVFADKRSATIAGEKTKLAIRIFGPAMELAGAGPVDFDRSWIFAETGVAWYEVSGEYAADENNPLVTVLLPYAADAEPPAADVDVTGDRIVVRLASGSTVEFVKTDAGWKLAESRE